MNIKANFAALVSARTIHAPVLLAVSEQGGKIESITIFEAWKDVEDATKPIESFCGILDICYSSGCTYKMLDRKDSGLRTGVPLEGESFEITSFDDAVKKADALHKKKLTQLGRA